MSTKNTTLKKIKFSDSDKVHSLIALYNLCNTEIIHCKDLEWKLAIWTTALYVGIITLTHSTPSVSPHTHIPYLKTLIIIFSLVVAGYSVWAIYHRHQRLTEYRNIRRKCSRILGYFDNKVYFEGAFFPSEYKNKDVSFTIGIKYLILWWGMILMQCAYSIYRTIVW